METKAKKPKYNIEDFVERRFKYKHRVLRITAYRTEINRYFIHTDDRSADGCVIVNRVTKTGIHWHDWVIDKKVSGFIRFDVIQSGLIEEKIS